MNRTITLSELNGIIEDNLNCSARVDLDKLNLGGIHTEEGETFELGILVELAGRPLGMAPWLRREL